MSEIIFGDVSLVVATALPVEQAAVKRILDEVDVEVDGFAFGPVRANGAVAHRLAVGILPQAGNTGAAAVLSDWSARFPNARYLVMVGIAGGIPSPEDAERHVRLGDVVVPDSAGVIEHDRGKLKEGKFEAMSGATPAPSSVFVSISRQLAGGAVVGEFPWQVVLEERFSDTVWTRPPPEADVLTGPSGEPLASAHPDPDPYRRSGVPRLVAGRIASGNIVVKDRSKREELAGLGVSAVEMEGAGVAASSWATEREYFAVRGIVDYSDGSKNNDWHLYGSAAAAAVLRAILDRKSPTIDEEPPSPLAIDAVQANYAEEIRRAASSAIAAAASSRGPVVEVIERWRHAHDAANRGFVGWDAETGETSPIFLSSNDVGSFTNAVVAALEAAKAAVGREVLSAATAISLLGGVTEDAEAIRWLAALQRALDALTDASASWPGAASRNKFEPPPLDDGGALAAKIESVRSALGGLQKRLAGIAGGPAPDPEPSVPVEATEGEQQLAYLHDLAKRLAPYRRVSTKPFDSDDHDAALAAAAALHHCAETQLYLAGLAGFPDLAAFVARNATRADWEGLIARATDLQPMSLGVEMLLAYRDVLGDVDEGELRELAQTTAAERLETLPDLIERDDFWGSTTGENARKLVQLWASANADNDGRELLGRLAAKSQIGLCRTLTLLAMTFEQTNRFTDETNVVSEIRDPFGTLTDLVRPEDVRAAIAAFLPEALEIGPAAAEEATDCVRFAFEFLALFPD